MTFTEKLRELESKATAGEWEAHSGLVYLPLWNQRYPEGQMRLVHSLTYEHNGIEGPNAALIAFLRNHAKAIADVVEAADKACRDFRDIDELVEALAALDK